MDEIQIRPVRETDAPGLLGIYRYYVEETAISFEWTTPTEEEFRARIRNTLQNYPYLAAERQGKLVGYAYAGPFIRRAAYDRCAEATIYLSPDERKRGTGRKLYEALEDRLRKMGILNLYACVGYPETEDRYLTRNSAEFHAHLGFSQIGRFHRCGYKFGRWYDMIWMEKLLGPHGPSPEPVRPWPACEG